MSNAIAIVGLACCFPDARSPDELWGNVLAQRQAFRRLPNERLRLDDYWSDNSATPDSIYSTEAALIEGYEFDRSHFRITGESFRSADLTHWLALDIAARALQDAGFEDGEGLRRESTGVFLGNTLTGEFSRAATLRLRWPFVRRVIDAALADEWSNQRRQEFLGNLETAFKKPFPAINEESLAGGLSNTIAGRICNHFDFKGGGYTVDGACASSLLALINGCTALVNGDLDTALVGGVDLSLDPFELVGFAKAGALATETMRVYDARSNGFWPGEGCGFVVLMRSEDARAQRLRTYALVRGWGISSDGSGGITRPEIEGQMLALKRAYHRAGFGIETISYFEGHGTGTVVGDTVELHALSNVIKGSSRKNVPAAIGSLKANIGHTKAAAGVAGLIKTALALNKGVIPPATGCENPHPALKVEAPALRITKTAEVWPNDQPRRAGVSSMGFGGINAHVVLEAVAETTVGAITKLPAASAQDAELFLFTAGDLQSFISRVDHLCRFSAQLSHAELTDLATHLERNLSAGHIRAAIVASTPEEFSKRLKHLKAIALKQKTKIDSENGVYVNSETISRRIGFLFPGQGSPSYVSGGALRRRFDFVEDIYRQAALPASVEETQTELAQPAIVMNSIAALRILSKLNVIADIAVGHSLGELTALSWAGAFPDSTLLDLACARGQSMGQLKGPHGGMLSVTAGEHDVLSLLNGDDLSIAAFNSDFQTVVSGEIGALTAFSKRAEAHGFSTIRLPVSHAFHSRLVADAISTFATCLSHQNFAPLQREIVSTITGKSLIPDADVSDLLKQQITSPVRFIQAVKSSATVDLWIEVGPGHVLQRLMKDITDVPVVSIDAGSESLKGLLNALGAAFVLGQSVDHRAIFAGRFSKPFDLNWRPKFFVNPCELAPAQPAAERFKEPERVAEETPISPIRALDFLKQLIAKRGELPALAISNESRFLSDLHLNSINVSQLVGETARYLGLRRLASAADFADATIEEAANALEEQLNLSIGGNNESDLVHEGVDSWVRAFRVELVERGLRSVDRKQVDLVASANTCGWMIFAVNDSPLVEALRRKFAEATGHGVVVVVATDSDESIIAILLQAAQKVLSVKEQSRFVLVQAGRSAAAFARTLHLESPRVKTCVVNVPPSHQDAADWIVAEALAANEYVEAHYDDQGCRFEPVIRLTAPPEQLESLALSSDDLILVSGGGKGITAECALALAKKSDVRLALIGRSDPDADPELSSNLERFKSAGVVFKYISADVTNADQIRGVIEGLQEAWGPVTGILHGSARNEPRLLHNLDQESFRQTLAVKVQGASNLLAAVDPKNLKLLVAFSSIIARTGLPGEADYGLANEWLTDLTEKWKVSHPHCCCLAVEWSIWAGKGMGERLGRTDRLLQQGITPIPLEAGTTMLLDLLRQPLPATSVIVMSRFSDLPTFKIERPALPFLRFFEQPKVFFPGIELVVDVDLSTSTDPYLEDHVFQGERVFPGVMGLEAMVQAASALMGTNQACVLENVKFNQPVIVPLTTSLTIRLVALKRGDATVEVALRSQQTGFYVNHFEATCRFEDRTVDESHSTTWPSALPLGPSDLYGRIFFQSGRFQRIKNYRLLHARECIVEITPPKDSSWFSRYLPGQLLLGDPGARDAVLHSIQACIPHRTILPVGVDRVTIKSTETTEVQFTHAIERAHSGNEFSYDVTVTDRLGRVRERWEALRLRAVAEQLIEDPWNESLLGPYIERCVQESIPGSSVSVVLLRSEKDRHVRSAEAIRVLFGNQSRMLRRPDGKPEVDGGQSLSLSHAADLTLVVTSPKAIACDVEEVKARSISGWHTLLGDHWLEFAKVVARTTGEELNVSATRMWTAKECLEKAGLPAGAPSLVLRSEISRCIVLENPSINIVLHSIMLQRSRHRFCLAILVYQ